MTPEECRMAKKDNHINILCCLHCINGCRFVSGSREQARHKPTVGFGGIND